jgi:glycosyltransferase involved in cell wall biosynthesis
MKPLKILQISTSDRGGGAEGSALNLFRVFRERGHKSWLVVGRKFSNDPDVYEIPFTKSWMWGKLHRAIDRRLLLLQEKIRGTYRLRMFLRGWSQIERELGWESFHYPGTRQLLNLAPELPDIVHAHNLHSRYFDLRFLAPLSHQVPTILNLRDMWLLTGHCAYSLGCLRWRTGCGKCPDLSIYPAIKRDSTAFNWQRKRRIYQKGHFYISTISHWLMEQTRASMLRGIQYRMIPNAIDLEVFQPGSKSDARTQIGVPIDARIVLLIAHNKFKDFDVMQNALRLLHKDANRELLFICLGRMDEDCILGQGRIIYPGFEREKERMAMYYRASDVFIHAAKDEAFGKTIVEAMACRTPVVATAIGGIPELIEDGATGYLVPPGDSIAMAQRVQQLLDDPILLQQVGERSSVVALHRFNLNRQADDFLGWYQEILDYEQGRNALPNAD